MEETAKFFKQKEEFLGIRLDKDLKEWCEKKAVENEIKVSAWIRLVLYKLKDSSGA